MGNTVSIESNILLFPSPEPSKRVHRHWTSSPVQRSSQALEQTWTPTYRPAPPTPSVEPLQNSAQSASLTCYEVTNTGQNSILTTLKSLCDDLRDPSDRRARTTISVLHEGGWMPRAIFHISGDFQNAHSNSLLSILLIKSSTRSDPDGEQGSTSSHSWLHIYDAVHLAQSFAAMLKVYAYQRSLRRLELDAEANEDMLGMLEGCAMVGVRYWVEGGQATEQGQCKIIAKMMKQLEGLLWGIWLEADDSRGDARRGGGCVPS
ncbi:uncharacterized protein K460DRAFT_57266 [Cucurbitaria berberidis CBS 394.84]|uniref:Uncharacterized protein n=1 Tax=Cucurbitaria berberidis CBS 394.84 TaxID=1168544 RepID=A0A9P4GLQ6_9PLEO|nr:uncharacterized protein K460DRAFT_57266 [Cucurbitaria berberidis CBS 394.84]KAF1847360.1 hypothetical protein K460DRAFT_57266 [Cucurbitaria berberidis CBS 394.84]